MTASISVVLPSYRRLARLPHLVEEYLRQGADEVVIVLDGPHPGWEHALPTRERLTVLELPENRGLALARIAGLEAATSDLVLAVDDDVVPGPGLVDAHRSFHVGRSTTVLQGYMPVVLPPHRGKDDSATYLYARGYDEQVRAWRARPDTLLDSLWGGNVSLPRQLYRRAEAHMPSIRLEYSEDLDLGLRLRAIGATAVFDDRARAEHHHTRDLAGFRRECLARGCAVADLERRWRRRPKQLDPLVTIPPRYNSMLAALQRSIARAGDGGGAENFVVGVYRLSGALRLWRLQDAAARLLRRALIMRGHRLARSRDPLVTSPISDSASEVL